jgi:hypothetical protein
MYGATPHPLQLLESQSAIECVAGASRLPARDGVITGVIASVATRQLTTTWRMRNAGSRANCPVTSDNLRHIGSGGKGTRSSAARRFCAQLDYSRQDRMLARWRSSALHLRAAARSSATARRR